MYWVVNSPREDLALWESLKIETRDDSEIIRTSFKCEPEIRVAYHICIEDMTIPKCDLKIQHLVTSEAIARSEVGHST